MVPEFLPAISYVVNPKYPPGTLVMMVRKSAIPEDIQPYGHKITHLESYRLYRQVAIDITIFAKDDIGLVIGGGVWNEAIILVGEMLFAVPVPFLREALFIDSDSTDGSVDTVLCSV